MFYQCNGKDKIKVEKKELTEEELKQKEKEVKKILDKLEERNRKTSSFLCLFTIATEANDRKINADGTAIVDKIANRYKVILYDTLAEKDLFKLWKKTSNIIMWIYKIKKRKGYWVKENNEFFSMGKYIKGFDVDFRNIMQFVRGEIFLIPNYKIMKQYLDVKPEDGNRKIFIENDKKRQILLIDEENPLKVNAIILFDGQRALLRIDYDIYDTIGGILFPNRAKMYYYPNKSEAIMFIRKLDPEFKFKPDYFELPKNIDFRRK